MSFFVFSSAEDSSPAQHFAQDKPQTTDELDNLPFPAPADRRISQFILREEQDGQFILDEGQIGRFIPSSTLTVLVSPAFPI